jgi:hypothetical protein
MQTRRIVVQSLISAAALAGVPAWANESVPQPTIIKGKPTILDYGGGLRVPCARDAFFTLWEGATFWLTFGFGISQSSYVATSQATKQATGVMRFLLLTLAFAPERLVKADGNGWRKKDPAARDFVLGELDLPVVPSQSMSDAILGGGNIEIGPLWNWSSSGMGGTMPSGMPNQPTAPAGPTNELRSADRHAFSTCFVWKKDLSLDDVRKRAMVLRL